ncbi:MAG: folylpolyglutamate synthase/dihydrofolate synthase family protein [Deltaproteobacteria bacterium]|nr:folylpolyglutamate synthase/dihydrofolate synthase family protein [Deltaproteobacteria bacterium]
MNRSLVDSYSETLNRIYNLRGGVIDLRLDRMERALALFNHPEKTFPSFHIAGTNGKGSTAAMLHRILCLGGYRTALYTSPHLVSFAERIRIGDREISPDEVVALAAEVWQRTLAADTSLTFFEFVTVMAFVHFARQEVDVAVVEVGLGGRLDATNLVRPVVSVITTISKDHEAYLGSDLRSIAREKAGIIKPKVPVVLGALPAEVVELFEEIALGREAQTYFFEREFRIFLKNQGVFDYIGIHQNTPELSLALRGRHQRNNAAVALGALEVAGGAFPVSGSLIREGLATVSWPGRFEIMLERPTVVLDGAHNGEGVKALVETIEDFRQGRRIKLLFASMEDKEWRLMLNTLVDVVDEVILTRVSMERSADPKQLASHIAGRVPHLVMNDARQGLGYLLTSARPNDIVLAAGSLYLLSEIRPQVQEMVSARLAGAIAPNSTV